ncbi:hypothetical protein [Microbulbifer sp. GL-2]|uniref:hypothetical protein n=1 Tax=Microbulbifer sp. GL-2 TaxID=2591606 RepID=UPI0011653C4C|nr:hypothetical protein [Microbulbifer sp. GL-2]BBM01954.1 hypothetical protein GL2_20280 [Microbulbifer sp. GL-2]
MEQLSQSIQAKAFSGELTEQWRRDNPDRISGDNSAAALLERIQAEHAAAKPAPQNRSRLTGRKTKIPPAAPCRAHHKEVLWS